MKLYVVPNENAWAVKKQGKVMKNFSDKKNAIRWAKRHSSKVGILNKHGKFQKIEEIMKVKGIGEKMFTELKDLITV